MIDNINDLIKTTPTNQQISLSALTDSAVKIDTMDKNTIPDTQQQIEGRPVVKLKSNPSAHRTIGPEDSVKEINPEDYIPKKTEEPVYTQRDKAVGSLADYIANRKAEAREFIKHLEEADAEHRKEIEDGIETVDGEVSMHIQNGGEDINNEPEVGINTDIDSDEEFEGIFEDDEFNAQYVRDFYNTDRESFNDEPEEVESESVEEEDLSEFDTSYVENPSDEAKEEVFEEYNDEVAEEEEEIPEEPEAEEFEEKESFVEEDTEPYVEEKEPEPVVYTPLANVKENISAASQEDFKDSEEDIDIDDDIPVIDEDIEDDDIELTDEEYRIILNKSIEDYKNEIIEKIINTSKSLDTSSFVVSNKVISVKDALHNAKNVIPLKSGSWPMMNAGRPFVCTPLKGNDLSLLVSNDDSGIMDTEEEAKKRISRSEITKTQAKIIYDHDANPYKPATFEAWCKTIPYWDYSALFGALYMASLDHANYVPRDCLKLSCQHVHLSDNTSPEALINFSNDEIKEKFERIKNVKLTPENSGGYTSVLSVINDEFAVTIKTPSLYTVLFGLDSLDEKYAEENPAMLSMIYFIDHIYYIDKENHTYNPIKWKTYPGDYTRTFKSKINTYKKIINQLNDIDFTILQNLVNSAAAHDPADGVTFRIPECNCPKCGSKIEATNIDIRYMLFIRQRLVTFATLPLEN